MYLVQCLFDCSHIVIRVYLSLFPDHELIQQSLHESPNKPIVIEDKIHTAASVKTKPANNHLQGNSSQESAILGGSATAGTQSAPTLLTASATLQGNKVTREHSYSLLQC